MFHLEKDNIHLNKKAKNKSEAIKKIASALAKADFVEEEGYVNGMLEREALAATYLGIGIAIPHGTIATRNLVKKTGVQIFCFPEGVIWGEDEEKAYLVIGIAASSDEHLELLRQLTHVLSADGVEEKIKNVKSKDEVISILTGENNSSSEGFSIDNALLLLDIFADDLSMLQALNCSRLIQQTAVNADFLINALGNKPSYLGDGVWINDSREGNLKNAMVISRTISNLIEDGKPVKLLITLSTIDDSTQNIINKFAYLAFNGQLNALISADKNKLIDILKEKNEQQSKLDNISTKDNKNVDIVDINLGSSDLNQNKTQEFIVLNENGLHTRPSSILVKVAKEFDSEITVANLDGSGDFVSAKSLMKLVALGAKKGCRLKFVAIGNDAKQALDAIGVSINSGLGEGEA